MAKNLDFAVQFETQAAADEFKKLFEAYIAGSKKAGDAANAALGGTVTKKVELKLEAKDGVRQLTTVVREARTELDKYESAFRRATKVDRNSLTSIRQQLNEAKQARDAIAKFNNEIDKSNRRVVFSAKLSPEWQQAEARVRTLQKELQNLELAGSSAFDKLGATFDIGRLTSIGRGISDIVNIFQSLNIIASAVLAPIKAVTGALAELQSFGLAFQAIGQGATGAVKSLADARNIALGLGVNIQTVREGFKQLSPVVLNSGGNLDDVRGIVESLSSRFAAFGLNADKSRRVLNGVIQAFAKGKLQAEELTQQISEADPAFKTDFANALFASSNALEALGGESAKLSKKLKELKRSGEEPVAAFEKLVKEGQITSKVLRTIIPELSKADLLFGKLGPTANSAVDALESGSVIISQVEANIANLNQLNLEQFAKLAEPLVATFLRAQAVVTDFITRILKLRATQDLVGIFNNIGQAVIRAVNAFTALAEAVLLIITPITSLLKVLTSVPGVLELIGIAIIGKFLNPLNALKGTLGENATATKGLLSRISAVWKGAAPVVDDYRLKIEKLTDRLTTPLVVKTIAGESKPDDSIVNARIQQEKDANKSIETNTKQTLDSVTARYRKYISEISQLQQKKSGEPTKVLRQQLNEQSNLLQAAIKEYSALPKTAQKAVGNDVLQLINPKEIQNIYDGSNAIKSLIDQYNDLVKQPELARATSYTGSSFLRNIRQTESELRAFVASNPDEGFSLLSMGAKIAATDVSRSTNKLQENTKKTGELIDEIKSTIKEPISASGQSIIDDTSIAKTEQLRQKIKNLESEIEKTKSAITSPSDPFTKKEEKRLTVLQEKLRKIRLEFRDLQKISSTDIEPPATDTGDLSDRLQRLNAENAAEKQLSKETKSRLFQEKLATSQTVAEINNKIAAKEEEVKATEKLVVAQRSFKLAPAESGALDSAKILSKQREELKELNNQRAAAVSALAAQADAESNLAEAQKKASRTGATLQDQLNFVKVATNVAQTSFNDLGKQIDNTSQRLSDAVKRFGELKSVSGTSIRTTAQLRELQALRIEIPKLEAELKDLRTQQRDAGGIIRDLGAASVDLNKQIKETGRNVGPAGTALKGFGNIANGLKGVLGNAFTGATKGISSLIALLGPLEIALIGVGIAIRAYNDANAISNQINEESARRIQVLDTALKELGGTAAAAQKPATGLALAWKRFAYTIKEVADIIGRLLFPVFDKVSSGVGGFITNLLKLAGAAGIGAAAGAALGAAWGAVGGPIGAAGGAVIGATVGLIAALAGSGSDAAVKLAELKEKLAALGATSSVENTKIRNLIAELKKLRAERDAASKGGKSTTTIDAKLSSGFLVARNAVGDIKKQIEELEVAQKQTNEEIDKMGPGIAKAAKIQEQLNDLQEKSRRITEKIQAGGLDAGTRKKLQQENKLTQDQIKALLEEQKKLPEASKEAQAKYSQLTEIQEAYRNSLKGLKADLKITEEQLIAFAQATGRVYDPVNQATSSVGQLTDMIKKLKEGAESYDLTASKGRANYDNDINKARQLQGILEYLSKTKWEVKLEISKLQNELNQAQLDLNLPPGPFREAAKVASQVKADLNEASQQFKDKVKAAQELMAQNPAFAKEAGEYIKKAALEYLVKTREGAAKIVEAARTFKEQLDAARSGLQDLKLNKSGFFTPEEIRANAAQIEQDYNAALARVREQTGRYDWSPTLDLSSADALLKSKKDFVDTRKEAQKLQDTMKQAADALTIAAIALAKIAKIELKDLGAAGKSYAKLFGADSSKDYKKSATDFTNYANNVLGTDAQLGEELGKGVDKAQKRVGKVLGEFKAEAYKSTVNGKTIELPTREYVLYYDNLKGSVQQVTKAEFERLQAADKANTKTIEGARQSGQAVGEVTGKIVNGVATITNLGTATGNTFGEVTGKMVNGIAVITDVGVAAQETGGKIKQAFAGGIASLDQYLNGLDAASKKAQNQSFVNKLQQTGQSFAAGPGATIVFPTKVQPPDGELIRQAAQQAQGDYNAALANLETKGFSAGDPLGGPAAMMGSWANDALDLAVSLQTVQTAQQNLNQATLQYEQAKAAGYSTNELEVYKAGVESAKDALAGATEGIGGLNDQAQAWTNATNQAIEYGIAIKSIPNVNISDLGPGGPTLEQSLQPVKDLPADINQAAVNGKDFAGEMEDAAGSAVDLSNAIQNIPTEINVKVNYTGADPRFAGGPVTGGSLYQVNELGQEGFLSNSGALRAINKPRNALWRPPSSGTVIPAHIWSEMKDAKGHIKSNNISMHGASSRNQLKSLMSMFGSYLNAKSSSMSVNDSETRRIQIHQTRQLARLAKAVSDLADKNWNVDVKVRNTGNTAYLDAINRVL